MKLRNNIIKSQPFYIQSNHLEAKLEQVITFSIVLDKNLCLLCVESLCLVSREHSEIASDRLSVRVGPYTKVTLDFSQNLIKTPSGDFKQVFEKVKGFEKFKGCW